LASGKQTPIKFSVQDKKRLNFDGENSLDLTGILTKEDDDSQINRAYNPKMAAN